MSDQTAQPDSTKPSREGLGRRLPFGGVSRRGLLRAAGASAAVVGGGGLLEACSSSIKGASSSSSSSSSSTTGAGTQDILIGFIHPLTGALADFGTSDNWIVSTIQATPQYKNGFKIGGKTYKVNDQVLRHPVRPHQGGPAGQPGDPHRQGGPDPHLLHAGDGQPGRDRGRETGHPDRSAATSRGRPGTPTWAATRPRASRRSSPPGRRCTSSASTTCATPSSRCGTGSTPS